MKIRKKEQSFGILGKIINSKSQSTNDTYSCDYINKINKHDTSEQEIGTWIDGKPLYRKVVTLSTTTEGEHNIDISNTNFDYIQLNTFSVESRDYVLNMYGADGGDDTIRSFININTKNVVYINGSAWALSTYYGVLEYTKTTD